MIPYKLAALTIVTSALTACGHSNGIASSSPAAQAASAKATQAVLRAADLPPGYRPQSSGDVRDDKNLPNCASGSHPSGAAQAAPLGTSAFATAADYVRTDLYVGSVTDARTALGNLKRPKAAECLNRELRSLTSQSVSQLGTTAANITIKQLPVMTPLLALPPENSGILRAEAVVTTKSTGEAVHVVIDNAVLVKGDRYIAFTRVSFAAYALGHEVDPHEVSWLKSLAARLGIQG